MAHIKFLKKGIKVDGQYIPVWYSDGKYDKLPDGTITIYAKEYGDHFPEELKPENNTDSQTDYFEKDRARITPGSQFYDEVKKAMGVR